MGQATANWSHTLTSFNINHALVPSRRTLNSRVYSEFHSCKSQWMSNDSSFHWMIGLILWNGNTLLIGSRIRIGIATNSLNKSDTVIDRLLYQYPSLDISQIFLFILFFDFFDSPAWCWSEPDIQLTDNGTLKQIFFSWHITNTDDTTATYFAILDPRPATNHR